MNDARRIYHVATFPRLSPVSYAGRNAKRDATAHAKRDGGTVRRMTGAQWASLAEKRLSR